MFSRQSWLIAIVFCMFSNVALAEGRCPPGMFETGSRDYIGCAPIPGYGQDNGQGDEGSAPPIPTVWETRWGAIATESKGSGFGAVTGFKSESSAAQAAVEQCRTTASISKNKCEVQVAYHNQCAVYAWGAGRSVAAHAIDIPTATGDALKLCDGLAGQACRIYYSGCSYAEAVPE